jgi:UDP-N-acetylmuramoyl-tripeptide--D-alanyl-D-alanine ligase
VEGVAREKGKLINSLPLNSFAVLNKENSLTQKMGKSPRIKVVWFGKGSQINAVKIKITKRLKTRFLLCINKESIEIELPLLGSQFVENALAAAAIGHICGANLTQIKKGLEAFEIPEHRMRPIRLKNGALILDDSYNNNPTAARLAIQTLKDVAGKKETVVVMGDMLELGKDEIKRHKELGHIIAQAGVKYLIGIGNLAKYMTDEAKKEMPKRNVFWYQTAEGLLTLLKPLLKRDTIILIKGSRSIALDKPIQLLH